MTAIVQQPQQLAPQGQPQVSGATQSLLVELFSRFFNRLLERESKFPLFNKEWENFKGMLLKEPLDLDSIFIHLASIQLNLEKVPSGGEHYPSVGTLGALGDSRGYIDNSRIQVPSQHTRGGSRAYTGGPDLSKRPSTALDIFGDATRLLSPDLSKRPSMAMVGPDLSKRPSVAIHTFSDLSRIEQVSYNTFTNLDPHLQKMRSNDESMSMQKLLNGLDVPKKYETSFLASKARRMMESLNFHSDMIIERVNNKQKKPVNMEERTPLRNVLMYNKSPRNGAPVKPAGVNTATNQVPADKVNVRPSENPDYKLKVNTQQMPNQQQPSPLPTPSTLNPNDSQTKQHVSYMTTPQRSPKDSGAANGAGSNYRNSPNSFMDPNSPYKNPPSKEHSQSPTKPQKSQFS